ncbi:MAG: hypothetical protein V4508_19920 [Pseudomonadota bacterium]
MDRSLKAALLSALVFPGAGQLYLRRYVPAAAFVLVALAPLWYLSDLVLARATSIVDQVLSGALAPDAALIASQIEHQSGAEGLLPTLAGWLLLACWVVSIADAWWSGRARLPEE